LVVFVWIIYRIYPLKAMSGETKEEEITSSKLSGGAANFGYYSRVSGVGSQKHIARCEISIPGDLLHCARVIFTASECRRAWEGRARFVNSDVK
jgi:hypothetical protein